MTDHFISSFGQTPPPALGQLRINPELGSGTLEALKKLGHKLVVRSGVAGRGAVRIDIGRSVLGRGPASGRRRPSHRAAAMAIP